MKNNFNNLFAFVLGRETKIARTELESVLRFFDICFSVISVSDNVAIIKLEERITNNELRIMDKESENHDSSASDRPSRDGLFNIHNSMQSLMALLGGTIKIFEIIDGIENGLSERIFKIICQQKRDIKGKLNFGISNYRTRKTGIDINKTGMEIKGELKNAGISSRFIALREGNELSSIVSYKNHLNSKGIEIGLFPFCLPNQVRGQDDSQNKANEANQANQANEAILLGKLIAVNNPEEWASRDYGKPRQDKCSGMTPPKLARALVNIALSQTKGIRHPRIYFTERTQKNNNTTIQQYNNCLVMDPFCGSGNILMEAAMLGCGVIGSDISKKAVEDTKANLLWLNNELGIMNIGQNHNLPASRRGSLFNIHKSIFVADATKIDFSSALKTKTHNLKTIVTEPYLGQPKKFEPTMNAVKGEYQKVKKLYIDFLKNLQPTAYNLKTICIVFPLVETAEGKRYSLFSESIDEIQKMGYTLLCEPLVYGREYQVVKRQVVLLEIPNIKSQI